MMPLEDLPGPKEIPSQSYFSSMLDEGQKRVYDLSLQTFAYLNDLWQRRGEIQSQLAEKIPYFRSSNAETPSQESREEHAKKIILGVNYLNGFQEQLNNPKKEAT